MHGRRFDARRTLDLALAIALALSLLAALVGSASADSAAPGITVCPSCPTSSIVEALAQVPAGGRITVRAGVYRGQLRIDRPVQLVGIGDPVIDGGDQGTVVTISAPDVTLQGFTVRGTGTSLDHEDAAIAANGERATLAGNRIEDALFGIYLRNAHGSVLRDNTVSGKEALPVGFRGDPIRIWYSNNVDVEGNVARGGRDIILWFSHDGVLRDNVFEGNRYGLHLMYSDRAQIEGNSLRDNSAGLYIMYSNGCVVSGNSLTDNHGPSGMGLGLKGDDDAMVQGNRFVSNRIGAQIDESPHSLTAHVTITGNVFAHNDTGIGFLPNVERNTVAGNDFIDNVEQVAILGGGQLHDISWTVNGRGNYWSDYVGFDANGDGIGDVSYRAQHLFESLIDNHESLRIFLFSPAVTAIDFAARAFPEVRPQTKLVDTAPLIRPVVPPGLVPGPRLAIRTRLVGGRSAFSRRSEAWQ
ncbi:MAG TPA: nitrous oxide reductase family maturation protein NosD [Thermomicrobiaceae bacterium]|nr:nitrous oxide reductase family maturation protein NosD [Thermomicrobiaceae bacterium]